MTELEKKIHDALIEFPRRNSAIEKDCAKHIAKIALDEIKEAFLAGFQDGEYNVKQSSFSQIYPSDALNDYLKEKGHE